MKRLLHLGVPLGSEIMTTVRLATGGVCSLAGLDLERSEDCKVCVTESLLLLTHAGYREASIDFSEDEGLRARIAGRERHAAPLPRPKTIFPRPCWRRLRRMSPYRGRETASAPSRSVSRDDGRA